MKKFLLIIPFVLLAGSLRAETGCLVDGYEELLIHQSGTEGTYFNDPSLEPPPGCRWVLVSYLKGCVGHGKGGIKGEYMLYCPLDDYVAGLFIFTGIAGVFYLGKKYRL